MEYIAGESGFSNPLTIDSKYYNKYTSDNVSTACNGSECISHGLSETAGWYSDRVYMINATSSWLIKGGNYANNTLAGNFAFITWGFGGTDYGVSFRLIMNLV